MAVWSSGSSGYVQAVTRTIFPKNIPLEFVWARDKCTLRRNYDLKRRGQSGIASPYYFVKRLHKVKRKGYRMERILIVDDSPHKCIDNYGNAIYPKEYFGNQEDTELLQLAKYLELLKDVENVRAVEKRWWSTEI